MFSDLIKKKSGLGASITARTPSKIDDRLAAMGRKGDTIIAHLTPREAMILKAMGGRGGINPKTGMLEFWGSGDDDDIGASFEDSASYGGDEDGGYAGQADDAFGDDDTGGPSPDDNDGWVSTDDGWSYEGGYEAPPGEEPPANEEPDPDLDAMSLADKLGLNEDLSLPEGWRVAPEYKPEVKAEPEEMSLEDYQGLAKTVNDFLDGKIGEQHVLSQARANQWGAWDTIQDMARDLADRVKAGVGPAASFFAGTALTGNPLGGLAATKAYGWIRDYANERTGPGTGAPSAGQPAPETNTTGTTTETPGSQPGTGSEPGSTESPSDATGGQMPDTTTTTGGATTATTDQEKRIKELQLQQLERWMAEQEDLRPYIMRQYGLKEVLDPVTGKTSLAEMTPQEKYDAMDPLARASLESDMAGRGLDVYGNKLTEEQRLARMSDLERSKYESDKMSMDRQLKALKGELPISPALEQELADEEQRTESTLSSKLGSKWRLSTPGIQTMGNLAKRAALIREEARRGEITAGDVRASNATAADLNRRAQSSADTALSSNIRNVRTTGLTNYPASYAGIISSGSGMLVPYENARTLSTQIAMQNQASRAAEKQGWWGLGGSLYSAYLMSEWLK